MSERLEVIENQLLISRKELKNLRQELCKLKAMHKADTSKIKSLLESADDNCKNFTSTEHNSACCSNEYHIKPIGYIESCFKTKNGTPRQASLCPSTKASLKISKDIFTNPEHSIIGLKEFSHLWILFVFHQNKNTNKIPKAKVHPPRMNGSSVGVFSTRSPHRPNAIGLSLSKVEKIIDSTIFLSGVDLIDGTPVLDIKPYIPSYDMPSQLLQLNTFSNSELLLFDTETNQDIGICNKNSLYLTDDNFSLNKSFDSDFSEKSLGGLNNKQSFENSVQHTSYTSVTCFQDIENDSLLLNADEMHKVYEEYNKNYAQEKDKEIILDIKTATWLYKLPATSLQVDFTNRAKTDLAKFHRLMHSEICKFCFKFFKSISDAEQAIIHILETDPRSVYRRNKCKDRLYYFTLDNMHITCWFDYQPTPFAEVLRILPKYLKEKEYNEIQ